MGCIFAPAIGTATLGVEVRETGVASAMVNTSQQIGGSVGLALLSTVSASAAADYARAHVRLPRARWRSGRPWLHDGVLVGGGHLRHRASPGAADPALEGRGRTSALSRTALARGIAYAHHLDAAAASPQLPTPPRRPADRSPDPERPGSPPAP